jgi:hypothetical protein
VSVSFCPNVSGRRNTNSPANIPRNPMINSGTAFSVYSPYRNNKTSNNAHI